MDVTAIMTSPMLWILSGIMVVASVSQAIVFFKESIKECKNLGISKERYTAGIRSACITSLGPSLSPVVSVLALMAVVGAPTTWMRLCDVGAARTELGVVAIVANILGVDTANGLDLASFDGALWGMALNNIGWLLITFALTHKMSGIVSWMDQKYDPKWIKALLAASTMAMFAYLLSNQLYTFDIKKWTAALVSGGVMLVMTTLLKKHKRLQEVALGVSLICGILITQAIHG